MDLPTGCTFSKEWLDQVARLQQGQRVRVIGTFRAVDSAFQFDNCALLEKARR
jgi:hypothetical protein